MNLKNYTFIAFLMLSLVSCSHQSKVKKRTSKYYSADVEREFSDIEMSESQRMRIQALERYRKLRLQRNQKSTKSYRPKKISYAKPVRKTKPKRRIIYADPNEMAIEIEQKLTYYCMKNRKKSKYSRKGSCQEFTNTALINCKDQFASNDKNLLKCVERRIR